jgi:hypothetical protein
MHTDKHRLRTDLKDNLRSQYDLSKLKNRVRGKYVERFQQGTNLVLLEPEVAEAFPDSEAVNNALRMLMQVAENQSQKNLHR